jgi:site-specific DNA recombinase
VRVTCAAGRVSAIATSRSRHQGQTVVNIGSSSAEVEPEEAVVIRRIFELCAARDGLKGITKTLNAEGTLAPRSQRGRPRAWAPSSVRAVLYRDCYRGALVWNKTRKRDQWGRKRQRGRPSTEWIRVGAEDLRIVSDALWAAAHGQLTERRENYRIWTRTDARRGPEARGSRGSYLLSGFARCGCCGGSVQVISRASTTGRSTWLTPSSGSFSRQRCSGQR